MNKPYAQRLPGGFPEDVRLAAVDLRPQHVNELAWPYPVALRAVDALSGAGCAILGGDVYRMGENGLSITGDNWYLDRAQDLPWADYVQAADAHARRYIAWCQSQHADACWYTLVFVSVDDYSALASHRTE